MLIATMFGGSLKNSDFICSKSGVRPERSLGRLKLVSLIVNLLYKLRFSRGGKPNIHPNNCPRWDSHTGLDAQENPPLVVAGRKFQ